MAMQATLKRLEARLGELLERYMAARQRVDELETELGEFQDVASNAEAAQQRIAELEKRVAELEEAAAARERESRRVAELESQRSQLADRLEDLLGRIDEALGQAD
ncbi:MAG: hypothetical protein GXP48_11545 [Acidobacteria bacterium]|nr:hypothetical protein [Acidobacteriota bacterium]